MSNYMIVDGEFRHHGVKGMKWGVRRDRTDAYKSIANRSVNELSDRQIEKGRLITEKMLSTMPPNIQLFAKNTQKNRKAQPMPKDISEIMTNASKEERESAMYVTDIGHYTFTVLNRPGDTPIILDKRPNSGLTRNRRGDKSK